MCGSGSRLSKNRIGRYFFFLGGGGGGEAGNLSLSCFSFNINERNPLKLMQGLAFSFSNEQFHSILLILFFSSIRKEKKKKKYRWVEGYQGNLNHTYIYIFFFIWP